MPPIYCIENLPKNEELLIQYGYSTINRNNNKDFWIWFNTNTKFYWIERSFDESFCLLQNIEELGHVLLLAQLGLPYQDIIETIGEDRANT